MNAAHGFVHLLTVGYLAIRGADRVKFLHNFCTADVKRLKPGEVQEAFVLNAKGKLVAHIHLRCHPDSFDIFSWPPQTHEIRGHLDRYLIRERVEMGDPLEVTAWFAFSPAARDAGPVGLLRNFTGQETPSPDESNGPPRLQVSTMEICGPGYLVFANESNSISDLATSLTGMGFSAASLSELELHRIRNVYPKFGVDINADYLPQEVQRDAQAISFDKGCYLGQETVARIDAHGHVNRVLILVTSREPVEDSLPLELQLDEVSAGRLTSAVFDPRTGEWWGLATIRRGLAKPGQELRLGTATWRVVSS